MTRMRAWQYAVLLSIAIPGIAFGIPPEALASAPVRSAGTSPAAVPETAGSRIAAARDAVLPYVVSILTVSQNFEQGEPTLSVSSGSGTVITPQGHIVTNAHVVEKGK